MIEPTWRIEAAESDETGGRAQPVLVSLHFLHAALRRQWRVWAALACIGMLLGVAWTVVLPAKSTGTVTLLLAHDPNVDPDQAMATDVSLLRTRTVAGSVIDQLDLPITPEDLLESLTVTPVSSSVLVIEVPAPDDAAAVARTDVLAETYLDFRTEQIESQSNALVRGYDKRIDSLQDQSERLTKQYNLLSAGGRASQNQATDVLAQRSQVNSEINSLQQTVQDASLKTESVIAASLVLDQASVVPDSDLKRQVLATASGLVGGMAAGMGLVIFMALTSDRLRRRDEVALAVGAPVRVSVSNLRRRPPSWRLRRGSSARSLKLLVHALDSAVPPRKKGSRKGRPTRLALATVDNGEIAELAIGTLAAQLAGRNMAVFVVDLSESGRLEAAVTKAFGRETKHLDPAETPVVYRPEGVPSLARGPIGAAPGVMSDLPDSDPRRPAWDRADVILTLAEVDPAVGVEHLKSWSEQVALLVTAGRSSAERLRTTAELIRSAGLALLFAMVVGADKTDESLGLPETVDAGWPTARRTS